MWRGEGRFTQGTVPCGAVVVAVRCGRARWAGSVGGAMRIATFNVLHGVSLADGQVDTALLAEAVRALDADVLALQEVDRGQLRSGDQDLTAIAAEAMGAVWHRFEPTVLGTPGELWRPCGPGEDDGGPAYGVSLLSPAAGQPVRRDPAAGGPGPLPHRAARRTGRRGAAQGRATCCAGGGRRGGRLAGHGGRHPPVVRARLERPAAARPASRTRGVDPTRWSSPATSTCRAACRQRSPAGAGRYGRRPTATNARVQLDHILIGYGRLRVLASGAKSLGVSDHCAAWADLASPSGSLSRHVHLAREPL